MLYWSLVLGLWLGIGGVATLAWVGAHLPPIQSLAIPKRPPSIQIEDSRGRVLATRGDMAGEVMSLKELPAYVPQAFVAIEDRRFYHALRRRPLRHRARVRSPMSCIAAWPRAAPPSPSNWRKISF